MKLIRNPSAVLSQLVETPSRQVLTKAACRIQVPERYTTIGLGQIGVSTFIYGCFAIILETGEYAVCNINAMVEITPYKILNTTVNDVPYHEFYFQPDQVVIKTTDLVKIDTLIYNVFDEFIFQGKIPWFMNYEDVGKLFDTAKFHANSDVAQNLEVIEFIASMITRSVEDRSKYIRTVARQSSDVASNKIAFVPLKSVFYSVNSTVNKLAGSYFSDGVTSALVKKTNNVEKIEAILRA